MKIKPEKVVSVREHLMCKEPDCYGEMRYTGMCQMISPPQYVHVCNHCGKKQTPTDMYPRIIFVTPEHAEELFHGT